MGDPDPDINSAHYNRGGIYRVDTSEEQSNTLYGADEINIIYLRHSSSKARSLL